MCYEERKPLRLRSRLLSKNLAPKYSSKTTQVSISEGKISKTYIENRINIQSYRTLFFFKIHDYLILISIPR